jgi:hypothetical protein
MRFFKRKGLLFLIPIAVMLLVFTNKLIEDQIIVVQDRVHGSGETPTRTAFFR